MNSVQQQCEHHHQKVLIESFHLSGHTFRFHWTVQDLEVFMVVLNLSQRVNVNSGHSTTAFHQAGDSIQTQNSIRSFTIMRRTFEHGTRVRLNFSGGPHTPVNMANSIENAGSWTVSGCKEGRKSQRTSRICEKLGIQNIAPYSAANTCHFLRFFPPTFTSSILSTMFTGECCLPEKLSLALMSRSIHSVAQLVQLHNYSRPPCTLIIGFVL